MKWLLPLLFLLSCIASNTGTSEVKTIYVDGCYYLVTEGGGICHKATCSNPLHNK